MKLPVKIMRLLTVATAAAVVSAIIDEENSPLPPQNEPEPEE